MEAVDQLLLNTKFMPALLNTNANIPAKRSRAINNRARRSPMVAGMKETNAALAKFNEQFVAEIVVFAPNELAYATNKTVMGITEYIAP